MGNAMTFTHDYYEQLGIPPTNDLKAIRRQFRLLARLYHPDINPSKEAEKRFQEVQAAYDVLSDSKKRDTFNQWLLNGSNLRRPVTMGVQLSPVALSRQTQRQRVYGILEIGGIGTTRLMRTALNVVLVLDRSSSMKGRRLYYVKEAARRILMRLSPNDYFGIVSFNDRAMVVLPTSPANNLAVAQTAIDGLTVSGGTEMASGLRLGLQEAVKNHTSNSLSHVIVLTDGRTYGDEAAVLDLATRAAEQNIGITAMGLGSDWNDVLLDEVAQKAGGRSNFIAEPNDAVAVFENTLQQLQRTFARNARLTLELGDGVSLIHAHEVAPGLRAIPRTDNELSLGGLAIEPSLKILLEFGVNLPPRDVALLAQFSLRYQLMEDGLFYRTERTAVLDVQDAPSDPHPPEVYEAAKRVAMIRLQERAWGMAEEGQKENAASELHRLADRFLEVGASDLAEATKKEAEQIRQTGMLSDAGRMAIKYGTRMLALPAPARR